jgi:hypothetical protein
MFSFLANQTLKIPKTKAINSNAIWIAETFL